MEKKERYRFLIDRVKQKLKCAEYAIEKGDEWDVRRNLIDAAEELKTDYLDKSRGEKFREEIARRAAVAGSLLMYGAALVSSVATLYFAEKGEIKGVGICLAIALATSGFGLCLQTWVEV